MKIKREREKKELASMVRKQLLKLRVRGEAVDLEILWTSCSTLSLLLFVHTERAKTTAEGILLSKHESCSQVIILSVIPIATL